MTAPDRPPTRRSDLPVEERSYRGWFVALAALVAAATAWAVWDETATRRPWKELQSDFNRLLGQRGQPLQPVHIVQVTNPELGVVDRCQSCHLGVDRPGFDGPEVAPVFRTHPRRDLWLGPGHRVDEIGCTPCHQGQGRQTKGVRGRPFAHGRNDPYWDRPLLSAGYTESTCVTCHAGDDPIPDAPHYQRGRQLFEDLRCFGCHASDRVAPDYAIAPPLDLIRDKSSRDQVVAWLTDPTALRPDTRMPRFWPEPIRAADGRPVDAATRAEWQRDRDQEIAAITAFVASLEPRQPLPEVAAPPAPRSGPPAAEKLFDTVGCRACHARDLAAVEPRTGGEPFGPNLARIGELATDRWLAAWLADPAAVWSGATMPNLRLSPDQRATLVDYLVARRDAGAAVPTAAWPVPDPARVAAGRRAIEKYGCYGCHDIPGFEHAGRAGVDLDGYGDKTAADLAWGDVAVACDRPTLECYTELKIASPRRFTGQGLIATMPEVDLTEADARDLAVFVLGHRRRTVPPAYRRQRTEEDRLRERGERLIARKGCRNCHEIGRTEKKVLDEDGELIEIEYTPIGAKALPFYETPAEAPPPLTFAGEKFQYPWLFEFLGAPQRIRPWLVPQMPSFGLTEAQRTLLVRTFAARDHQPYPFVVDPRPTLAEQDLGTARSMFETLQCTKCHQVSTATDLPVGDLAPDLALTAGRLRSSWQRRWLLEPQLLQPGTGMPTYFPLADEDDPTSATTPCPTCFGGDIARQIDALVSLTIDFAK